MSTVIKDVKLTGYYPSSSKLEGGYVDNRYDAERGERDLAYMQSHFLSTLQAWLGHMHATHLLYDSNNMPIGFDHAVGRRSFVSVAGDPGLLGSMIAIPSLDEQFGLPHGSIPFKIVDGGGAFPAGTQWKHLDICCFNKACSLDDFLNQKHDIALLS